MAGTEYRGSENNYNNDDDDDDDIWLARTWSTEGKKINNNNNNFEPIAVETLIVFNTSARNLLANLGRRTSINTREARETSYRIYILVQHFNVVLLHDSLPAGDCTD